MPRKIRVLVGKPGLDGHDRGAKVVAAALRDAGMEVIYTGLHQSPEQVVEAAVQEDVDVVALSILSGAHMTLFPEVHSLMRERGIGDRLLTGGGIIPPDDMASLAASGVGRLFGPGSSTQDIARYIRAWFAETHGEEAAAALAPMPAPSEAMAEESYGGPKASVRPWSDALPKPAAKPKRAARPAAKPKSKASPKPKSKPKAKPRRAARKATKPARAKTKRPAKKKAAKRTSARKPRAKKATVRRASAKRGSKRR